MTDIDFSTMKKIEPDTSSGLYMEWVMNNVCNYKCSYCSPSLNDGSFPIKDYDRIKIFFNQITTLYTGDKFLFLTGGEPTLWPPLIDFVNELGNEYYIKIVTNGSRTERYFKKLAQCNNVYQIGLSVHLQYADIRHIQNIVEILGEHTQVNVDILADIDNFHKIEEWFEMAESYKLKCDMICKPIRMIDGGAQNYSSYQKQLLKNLRYTNSLQAKILNVPLHFKINGQLVKYRNVYDIISNKHHAFKNWKCNIGKQRLVLWYDGSLYGAQCSTARKHNFGNIYSEYSIYNMPVTCEDDFCMCLPDIRIEKNV